ncbi:MAG: hypothetical protein MZV65_30875 [Chromatiales bacterium]|nr:hypothetical protein [Chromatiales bacterium]
MRCTQRRARDRHGSRALRRHRRAARRYPLRGRCRAVHHAVDVDCRAGDREVAATHAGDDAEARAAACEQAAVRVSLANLMSFPFVQEAVAAGRHAAAWLVLRPRRRRAARLRSGYRTLPPLDAGRGNTVTAPVPKPGDCADSARPR